MRYQNSFFKPIWPEVILEEKNGEYHPIEVKKGNRIRKISILPQSYRKANINEFEIDVLSLTDAQLEAEILILKDKMIWEHSNDELTFVYELLIKEKDARMGFYHVQLGL